MGAIKSRKTADLIDVLKEAMMYPDSKGYYASGVILGETYLQQAQFKEALSVAHKIRSEHPAYGSAYHIAAEALIQMNQLKRARAILEEGLFYHPGHQGLSKLLDTIARLPFDTQPEGEQDSFHQ